MEQKFRIVLLGKTADGISLEDAKRNLAVLFKINSQKAEKLLSKPTVLKTGLNKKTAINYKQLLDKTGVLYKIQKQPDTVSASNTQPANSPVKENPRSGMSDNHLNAKEKPAGSRFKLDGKGNAWNSLRLLTIFSLFFIVSNVLVIIPVLGFGYHFFSDGLFNILLTASNFFLIFMTIIFYHHNATIKVRQYVLIRCIFDGERFEYTGTAMELFLGLGGGKRIAILGSVLILFSIINQLAKAFYNPALNIIIGFLSIGPIMLYYYSRKDFVNRIKWHDIYFYRSGSAFDYAVKSLWYKCLSIISLGFYMPYMQNKLTDYKINNTYFGNERFSYDGKGKDLFPAFIKYWLLFVPTLGLSWFWYKAARLRYEAEHTHFQSLSFRYNITGKELLSGFISDIFLVILAVFTLTFISPWFRIKNMKDRINRLEVEGCVTLNSIRQHPDAILTKKEKGR